MSDYLTNSLDTADALVDISNVVRNEALGGSGKADFVRLERVALALADMYNDQRVTLFGVTDRSLFHRDLFDDPWQLHRLDEWESSGKILVAGKADPQLLAAGEETGLPIISGDHFRGHRREFPYLDQRDDALLEPWADGRGTVRLRHPEYESRPEWEVSRIEEIDLLLQQGINEHREEVLGRFWSCPDERCSRHEPAGKPFVLLPLWRRGRLICDVHGLEMEDRGPRPRMVQLKIRRDGTVCRRFSVAEGESMVVGRSGEGIDLYPFLDAAERSHVSRVHLRFDLNAEGLTITDLSTNGTTLILQGGRRRLNLRRHTQPFTVGDEAEIVPGLEIVRSGRQYPSELPGPPRLCGGRRSLPAPGAKPRSADGTRASRSNLGGEDNGQAEKCRT